MGIGQLDTCRPSEKWAPTPQLRHAMLLIVKIIFIEKYCKIGMLCHPPGATWRHVKGVGGDKVLCGITPFMVLSVTYTNLPNHFWG